MRAISSAYDKLDRIQPPIEKPLLLHVSSVFKIMAAKATQNKIADNMSPCFTPFLMSTYLLLPISVLIDACDPSYTDFKRLI